MFWPGPVLTLVLESLACRLQQQKKEHVSAQRFATRTNRSHAERVHFSSVTPVGWLDSGSYPIIHSGERSLFMAAITQKPPEL